MDSTILMLIGGIVLTSLSTPLTIFVLHRWGMVGGSPREVVALQLELERKKIEFENKRLAIGEEERAIRKRQQEIQAELKRAQYADAQMRQQHQMVNPSQGFRGNLPPQPNPNFRGPPNGT